MNDLAIMIGLQASGKSSFYRHYLAQTHVLVSKDLMRNNRRPARRQVQLISEALIAGKSVAVDNTNATIALRRELIELGKLHSASLTGYFLEASLEDCMARNAARPEKNRVPDVGLFSVVKSLTEPSFAEGFDRLFRVKMGIDFDFSIVPWAPYSESD